MCFSSDARCLEHFQMSPVFIQRLPPWAARQEACVLTVGPISPSDHRCDETAYNLAELGYYSHLVKRRREAQRFGHGAQPHSYYAARLGLEPGLIRFQSLWFFHHNMPFLIVLSPQASASVSLQGDVSIYPARGSGGLNLMQSIKRI